MSTPEQKLAEITAHEEAAAEAGVEFEEQIQAVRKLVADVALSEVEHEMHAADPELSRLTRSRSDEISRSTDTMRETLQGAVEAAIGIKKRALWSENAVVQARQDLFGPEQT